MNFVLTMMLVVSTYSLANTLYKYFGYSKDCNPKILPHWVASLLDGINLFVTRQLWIYVISVFFWPTKKNLELDETFDAGFETNEDDS